MSDEQVPHAVIQGRRVAMALLITAMVSTVLLAVWLASWWATRPIVF